MVFMIESQGKKDAEYDDRWSSEYIGDENHFDTEAEAEEAIASLRELGEEWANAPYRVVATE